MKLAFRSLLVTLAGVVAAVVDRSTLAEGVATPWVGLDAGFELAEFRSPVGAEEGDSVIRILRIDPKHYSLELLNASAPGQGLSLTAREWCARNGLHAAINASMFQEDLRTSVSLMRTKSHTNNTRVSRDMAILAFDRVDPAVPEVQIIDRECEDFSALRTRYGSLVQSIRMISCTGKNVWSPQARRFSIAAVGTDDAGRVLFVHSRSPRSVHDFINVLLALPIGLRRALYAEGGPEAQLFVRGGGREYEFVGSYGSSFMPSEDNKRAWRIPNVIGVAKRPSGGGPAAAP